MMKRLMIQALCLALWLGTACDSDSDASGDDGGASGDDGDASGDGTTPLADWCSSQPAEFSFFVTSMDALWILAGSAPDDLDGGFGGDFGGLAGADDICQTIGAATGHGGKTWRAFLSATDDGAGNAVHAIERIGTGPWHDANGRLVATGIDGLLGTRPDGDPQSTDDLPDECGVPITLLGDAHDVVTASDAQGRLANTDPESTCLDWTSSDGAIGSTGGEFGFGTVMCGHSFPRATGGGGGGFGANWVSDHGLRGCGKGANLIQNGAGTGTCIGCTGGYGAMYCFAL